MILSFFHVLCVCLIHSETYYPKRNFRLLLSHLRLLIQLIGAELAPEFGGAKCMLQVVHRIQSEQTRL